MRDAAHYIVELVANTFYILVAIGMFAGLGVAIGIAGRLLGWV